LRGASNTLIGRQSLNGLEFASRKGADYDLHKRWKSIDAAFRDPTRRARWPRLRSVRRRKKKLASQGKDPTLVVDGTTENFEEPMNSSNRCGNQKSSQNHHERKPSAPWRKTNTGKGRGFRLAARICRARAGKTVGGEKRTASVPRLRITTGLLRPSIMMLERKKKRGTPGSLAATYISVVPRRWVGGSGGGCGSRCRATIERRKKRGVLRQLFDLRLVIVNTKKDTRRERNDRLWAYRPKAKGKFQSSTKSPACGGRRVFRRRG